MNDPTEINKEDIIEQFGSMVLQIITEQKKNKLLEEKIKELRRENK